jgi:parvulin-like peptidyl-prolyl isomerase
VTRSKEGAKALATDVHARAAGGANFAALAGEYSDGPSAKRGGALGVYLTGTMVPKFEAATAAVAVGKIAPLIETPFGFHVIRRDAVVQIRASHILVSWEDAWRSAATRTQEQARSRIEEARKALEGGKKFADVAAEYSEDTTAATGGDLGPIAPGQMLPAFEEAAMALEIGALSGVVETPYGFHLILRTE